MDQNIDLLKKYEDLIKILPNIYKYLFLPIGIIGNLLSIVIFLRSTFRSTAMGLYQAAISIQSEIFLVSYYLNINLIFLNSEIMCKIQRILPQIFLQSTTILVTVVSVDRFLLVFYPKKFVFLKTLKFQLIVVLLILVFSILLNLVSVFNIFYDSLSMRCGVTSDYIHTVVISVIDLVFCNAIPMIIMIITSALVISKVFKLKRKLNKDKKLSRKEYNFAIATIVSVVFFMVCCLPYFMSVVALIYLYVKQKNSHIVSLLQDAYASRLSDTICWFFRFCFFSFSFIAHLSFNFLYRSELISLFRIKRLF
jgi:hypothetical protein